MITLDLDRRELTDGVRTCRITGQMCDILEALQFGEVVNRSDLIAHVWPVRRPRNPGPALNQQVFNVRLLLLEAGMPSLVETAVGVGYVLTEPLAIVGPDKAIMVNSRIASLVLSLLASHPDRVAADRVLVAMVG